MPNISAGGNTRSVFPTTLDTWTAYGDSEDETSLCDAEIWNKLETAVLRTQEYAQKVVGSIGTSDRRLITKRAVVTLGADADFFQTTLTLTALEALFLQNALAAGNVVLASVHRTDGAGKTYRAGLMGVVASPPSLTLRIDHIDLSQQVDAADYQVQVTWIAQ